NARKLDPIESAKEHMDKVTFYNHDGLPSKLEIEKDIAALEQDPVSFDKKKNAPKLSAKKTSSNKDKSTSSADKKVTHNTHDLESKPIPLPFE
ncbi:MAG: hypothetical protein K0T99_01255, partial [Alphaproteobacteria bacterium]|nr:hypothetical protein [Alphaproteobacteria bacterium]